MSDLLLKDGYQLILQPEGFKLESGARPFAQPGLNSLDVPRGSWAGFSLVLLAPEEAILLTGKRAAFTPRGPLPILRVEVCIEGLSCQTYVADMHRDDDEVLRADALLTQEETHLLPYLPRQLYVRAPISEAEAPGLRAGKVCVYAHTLFEDERLLLEADFNLRIRSLRLPAPGQGHFFLNLWQHPSNIARKHELALFSDAHFAALEEYARALHDLGNQAATVIASDIPWAGQFCFFDRDNRSNYYEYNYVRVFREKDGTYRYDFSVLDRYLKLFKKYGMTRRIMVAGLIGIWKDAESGYGGLIPGYGDAPWVSYLDLADNCIKFMRTPEQVEAYVTALYQWFRENGYIEQCVVMPDEPDSDDHMDFSCMQSAQRLLRLCPEFKLELDVPPAVLENEMKGLPVWDYTPSVEHFHEPLMQACRARVSGLMLWSTCCYPLVPNSFLHSPLNEVRLHGLFSEYLHTDGFLRWNFTAWPENPREEIRFRRGNWSAGDTCFVYPSRGGHCLYSLRYFALRRGIEDYELMQMVKERCPNAQAILDQAFDCVLRTKDLAQWNYESFDQNDWMFSVQEADYVRAREILMDALEKTEV
jgi:hypothetical protein